MNGIDLNRSVTYRSASLRFFKPGEHHVSRFCRDNVLLLVFEGVLRFSEDGSEYEVHPGQYHIQHCDTLQDGVRPSDAPNYLYVHFLADWAPEGPAVLPRRGAFDYARLKPRMDTLDALEHSGAPYVTKAGVFCELLSALHQPKPANSTAEQIALYISNHYLQKITLDMLCDEFHFSKNHVIHLFKDAFGVTPITYVNRFRLQKAEYRMEVFSDSLEQIALQCGFQDYSHFYKLFCRTHGISPEQWRKQKRLG